MLTKSDFDIAVETDAGRVCVRTSGEIDMQTADELEARIAEASQGAREVHLDLSGVTFMDSSGVYLIRAVMLDAALHGRRLTIAPDLPAPVERLFALTGILGNFLPQPDDGGSIVVAY